MGNTQIVILNEVKNLFPVRMNTLLSFRAKWAGKQLNG